VFALLFVLAIAAMGAIAYLQWQAKVKRREAIHEWAFKNGLEYTAVDNVGLPQSYDFGLFRKGDGRGCENVLQGAWKGVPVIEADYWYYTTSTDSEGRRSRDYTRLSVAIFQLDAFVPDLRIEHENVFTRLADHVGLRDIEFESDEFNRRFNVKCADREFAFKLLDARMMQWLLGPSGALCFEVNGAHGVLYCDRIGAERVPELLDSAKGFVDHVPKLVWNEYGKAAS
jgi:hypothetical protein